MDQYNRIAEAILTLDTMPERIRIMDLEPERKRKIRRMAARLFPFSVGEK